MITSSRTIQFFDDREDPVPPPVTLGPVISPDAFFGGDRRALAEALVELLADLELMSAETMRCELVEMFDEATVIMGVDSRRERTHLIVFPSAETDRVSSAVQTGVDWGTEFRGESAPVVHVVVSCATAEEADEARAASRLGLDVSLIDLAIDVSGPEPLLIAEEVVSFDLDEL